MLKRNKTAKKLEFQSRKKLAALGFEPRTLGSSSNRESRSVGIASDLGRHSPGVMLKQRPVDLNLHNPTLPRFLLWAFGIPCADHCAKRPVLLSEERSDRLIRALR